MEYHLAPLKNVSSWAFRATCVGATDSYTEMINIKQLLNLNSVKWNTIDTYPISHQNQWIQVLAQNPNDFIKFSDRLQKFSSQHPDRKNIFGININAGCPDKHVIAAGEGAALIYQSDKLISMIKKFLGKPESHPYAISIKMRLGQSIEELNQNLFKHVLEKLNSLDDPRIKPTIIHFKHATQNSFEIPRWDMLEVALDTQTPLILNGNIRNRKDLQAIHNLLPHRYQTDWKNNIKGIMIGREAIKNPDCFLHFNSKKNATHKPWRDRLKENLRIHLPSERFTKLITNQYGFEKQSKK